jgi:hypothetical protein
MLHVILGTEEGESDQHGMMSEKGKYWKTGCYLELI